MPNRTIYLPDDLDELSRRLGINLSRLTQEAIERAARAAPDEVVEAQVADAMARIAALGIEWPKDALATSRAEAGER